MFLAVTAASASGLAETGSSGEPGWSMRVIATGEFREQIQSTPIVHRPYRPLHIYGNTVRRRHYRGTALPLPRSLDLRQLVRR